jgi:hypothetical protein
MKFLAVASVIFAIHLSADLNDEVSYLISGDCVVAGLAGHPDLAKKTRFRRSGQHKT